MFASGLGSFGLPSQPSFTSIKGDVETNGIRRRFSTTPKD